MTAHYLMKKKKALITFLRLMIKQKMFDVILPITVLAQTISNVNIVG